MHQAYSMKLIIEKICKQADHDPLAGDGTTLELWQESKSLLPLYISAYMPSVVDVSHEYIQNGDRMYDPRISFWVGSDGKWYPSECEQSPTGSYTRCITGWKDGKPTTYVPAFQKSVASLARIMGKNIRAFGYHETIAGGILHRTGDPLIIGPDWAWQIKPDDKILPTLIKAVRNRDVELMNAVYTVLPEDKR